MKARLILEDGTVFNGKAFGYLEESVGEVVFKYFYDWDMGKY